MVVIEGVIELNEHISANQNNTIICANYLCLETVLLLPTL